MFTYYPVKNLVTILQITHVAICNIFELVSPYKPIFPPNLLFIDSHLKPIYLPVKGLKVYLPLSRGNFISNSLGQRRRPSLCHGNGCEQSAAVPFFFFLFSLFCRSFFFHEQGLSYFSIWFIMYLTCRQKVNTSIFIHIYLSSILFPANVVPCQRLVYCFISQWKNNNCAQCKSIFPQ